VETVQALLEAAAVVERELPGGHPLVVNDIGFAAGGPIAHHGSHQSGRDVDVLFYLHDREGRPRPAKGVPLDTKGRGWDFADLLDPADDEFVKIDAARTWRFLQALAEDDAALVQRVFVAEHLRTILLAAAKRAKAPRDAVRRVEELTCQPGTPHDDHFHIRFFCTGEDLGLGCLDSAPVYPWRVAQLKAAGLAPALWRPSPARRRAKTTTAAQAAAEAGPMHWKVKAFLNERETWSKQPHPGRPYCR
jgi:penicillin-insensitive murein endopeptidase